MIKIVKLIVFITTFMSLVVVNAQKPQKMDILSLQEQAIIKISATATTGDLVKLKNELNYGLFVGLTINQIKDMLVQLYAYAGFPRSIRSLQTFIEVLDKRKAKGIIDLVGPDASLIKNDVDKYERGKKILENLTGVKEKEPKIGYSTFSPEIDIFLKEHLFADIFERDVLTYKQRELVTVSILSSLTGVEPMLEAHMKISLNIGITPEQLKQFTDIISLTIGKKEGLISHQVLDKVLKR